MKRVCTVLIIVFILCGCSQTEEPIDAAMTLRDSVLSSNGTSFVAEITADYADVLYTFELECRSDQDGSLSFTVTAPKSVSGITGIISNDQQSLTFDDKILAFPPLSDGQLTPVIAPYLFLNSLRSGYLSACGKDGDGYCIYIDDTFRDHPLQLHLYTDADFVPFRAEMIYNNLRILSVDIADFTLL